MKTVGLQIKKASKARKQPKAEEVAKDETKAGETSVRKKGEKPAEQPKAEEVA